MDNSNNKNHFEEVRSNGFKLIEYHCEKCDLFFWLCQDEIETFRNKKCPECGGMEDLSLVDDSIKITNQESNGE